MLNNSLIDHGSDKSEIGIITLWTKKDIVKKVVNKSHYRYIGQLYSSAGISTLIRNCLYDKKIRHLVLIGQDLSKSGDALINLFCKGVDSNKCIIGTEVIIEPEIPKKKIILFTKKVKLHDLRNLDLSKLNIFLSNLNNIKFSSYGDPEKFPQHKIQNPERYPARNSGFLIIDDYIGNAWLKILTKILKFGVDKPTSYNENQKEILNLVTVIIKENPENPIIEEYFNFSKKDLEDYYPQILTPKKYETLEYTYGLRLQNHHGVDQVQQIITKLKQQLYTRRAVAITWDIKDSYHEYSPCLILIQAVIQDHRLFLTAFFRSNDMYNAWPRNAYALRKLQFYIADKLDIKPGSLTTISSSAHIYASHFKIARKILNENHLKRKIFDSRGNLIITLKNKFINVQHQNNTDKILGEYQGKNAKQLIKKLLDNYVISEISHALDIGSELQKAEIALNNEIKYVQDQALRNL